MHRYNPKALVIGLYPLYVQPYSIVNLYHLHQWRSYYNIFYVKDRKVWLTHLSQMGFPTLINWSSLFPFKGLLGGIFSFYSNCKGTFCKQIVESLIRWCVLSHLIWFCTVCLCPTKRTLCLYGLSVVHSFQICSIIYICWFRFQNLKINI